MKTQLRNVTSSKGEETLLAFVCPGCKELTNGSGLHMLPVTESDEHAWQWNGDSHAPTLAPSILTSSYLGVCHSFLRDGYFEFLDDCTHSLAGQRIAMDDLPTWFTKEGR